MLYKEFKEKYYKENVWLEVYDSRDTLVVAGKFGMIDVNDNAEVELLSASQDLLTFAIFVDSCIRQGEIGFS